MQTKTTNFSENRQLPAGLSPDDHNIEFIGNRSNKTVIWMQRGNSHEFKTLPKGVYEALRELFLSDEDAFIVIPEAYPEQSLHRHIEIYTYYMYGDLDNTPDVIDGKLQPCENFRETMDCISVNFKHKFIDIEGEVLSLRDIKIIDSFARGIPDKAIAQDLDIAQSTFDFHKRRLFKKLNIQTKPEALMKAFKSHVICPDH